MFPAPCSLPSRVFGRTSRTPSMYFDLRSGILTRQSSLSRQCHPVLFVIVKFRNCFLPLQPRRLKTGSITAHQLASSTMTSHVIPLSQLLMSHAIEGKNSLTCGLRQVLLKAVAAEVAIGYCDASLTLKVVAEATHSIPHLADQSVFDMLDTLISLLPLGYARQLTGLGIGKQRIYPKRAPVNPLVDTTWLCLPDPPCERLTHPLNIVAVSQSPKHSLQPLVSRLIFKLRIDCGAR